MSSSSSTAPPSPLGECVVCGKETSTRCSSCAQGGVDWMFFCSKDHQKLIWYVHKRVCGGKFKIPRLKDTEQEEMLELSTRKNKEGFGGFANWAEQFQAILEFGLMKREIGTAKSGPEMFKTVVSTLGKTGQVHEINQRMLFEYRRTAFSIKTTSIRELDDRKFTYGDFRRLVGEDPFGYLAASQRKCDNLLEDYSKMTWYSDFQFRMLNFIGLIIAFDRSEVEDEDANETFIPLLVYALTRIRTHIRETISVVEPEFADCLVKEVIPGFTEMLGMGREPDRPVEDKENSDVGE